MVNWSPPPTGILRAITAPFHTVLEPVFVNPEDVPQSERPLLFVSNHTIMGLDYPLLLYKLWTEHKIFVRALADHSHFQVVSALRLRSKLSIGQFTFTLSNSSLGF